MLAWRPGELTRRYIDGERARFVSPIALFLFSVFLMFAVLSVARHVEPRSTGSVQDRHRASAARGRRPGSPSSSEARRGGRQRQADRRDRRARSVGARGSQACCARCVERGVLSGSAVQVSDDLPTWVREPGRAGQGEPRAADLQAPDQRLQIQLGADPAVGAVPVAAVPVQPPLPALRPHGVRDLFAGVHDAAGDRGGCWSGGANGASRSCSFRRSTCIANSRGPTA